MVAIRLRRVTRARIQDALDRFQKSAAMKKKVVHVKLDDGRVLAGTVCAVEKTVAGTKVRVLSGDCLVTVGADRVVKVVKK